MTLLLAAAVGPSLLTLLHMMYDCLIFAAMVLQLDDASGNWDKTL